MPKQLIIKYPSSDCSNNTEQEYFYALINKIEKCRSCQQFSITLDVYHGNLIIDLDQQQPIKIQKSSIISLIVMHMESLRKFQNKEPLADELEFENEIKNIQSNQAITMEALYQYISKSVRYDDDMSWLTPHHCSTAETWLGRCSTATKVGLVILCAFLLLAGILPGLIAIAVIIIAQLISYYNITHKGDAVE